MEPAMKRHKSFPLIHGQHEATALPERVYLLLLTQLTRLCLCLAACACTGCMTWHPQWPDLSSSSTPSVALARLEKAEQLGHRADSRSTVTATVAAYQSVLDADPGNFQALVSLAQLNLLLGDGYTTGIAEKKTYFHNALIYAEGAMFTNPSFRKKVLMGEPTWEACRVLSVREIEAMLFWVNAVFYSYKEGQLYIGQVINYRWIQRARKVMEHMTSIDPDWGGGALHFTWGVYFLSIPESIGGDRKKSAAFFAKAIEIGPERLLNRWGQAKYFHVKMKDPTGFRKDLEWVLSRDVERSPGNYSWNAFFAKDARRLLAEMDRHF
jgi:hypothetical protein